MTERINLAQYRESLHKETKPGNKKKRPREDREHNDQVELIKWCDLQYQTETIPELEFIHAVPNGSKRPKGVGGYLAAEGVKSGVVDLFWDLPRGCYHGFRAELKVRDKNNRLNKPNENQKKWIAWYREQGYHADWYEGWIAISKAIEEYYSLGPFKIS